MRSGVLSVLFTPESSACRTVSSMSKLSVVVENVIPRNALEERDFSHYFEHCFYLKTPHMKVFPIISNN